MQRQSQQLAAGRALKRRASFYRDRPAFQKIRQALRQQTARERLLEDARDTLRWQRQRAARRARQVFAGMVGLIGAVTVVLCLHNPDSGLSAGILAMPALLVGYAAVRAAGA